MYEVVLSLHVLHELLYYKYETIKRQKGQRESYIIYLYIIYLHIFIYIHNIFKLFYDVYSRIFFLSDHFSGSDRRHTWKRTESSLLKMCNYILDQYILTNL